MDTEVAKRLILDNACDGTLAAKADWFGFGKEVEEDATVPALYWSVIRKIDSGHDWARGSFSYPPPADQKTKAFGVSFDYQAISQLIPAEDRARALRQISVVGNSDWVSSNELHKMALEKYENAPAVILSACQTGKIAARSARTIEAARDIHRTETEITASAMECDVTIDFWTRLAKSPRSKVDFSAGHFVHTEVAGDTECQTEILDVYFHRSGLINLGLESELPSVETVSVSNRGRRPTYDWGAAMLAVFGLIHRGEFMPKCCQPW